MPGLCGNLTVEGEEVLENVIQLLNAVYVDAPSSSKKLDLNQYETIPWENKCIDLALQPRV